MSGYSYGNRGLSGKRLYIIIAIWLVLVIAGGFCTWYGWFGPGSEDEQPTAEATPTSDESESLPSPTAEALVVQPTSTSAAARRASADLARSIIVNGAPESSTLTNRSS